jgi:thiamine pyrophosphate-dependent acetolactate synthase large subunit-like protein
MHAYEAVGEVLRRLGVEVVFGLVGDGNMLYVTHMTQALGIGYYWARHENPAVSMADGYARVSGRLGVASVTQGPGITNALTALTEAVKGKTPLLLLTGATPTTTVGMPQDMAQAEAVSAVGVGVQRLRGAETLVRDLARAAHRAVAEERPVMLSIPVDIQHQSCPTDELDTILPPSRKQPMAPDPAAVAALASLVQEAARPVILAGRGAARSQARSELQALGDRIGALLATTGQGKALFAGDPFNLGVLGRMGSELAGRFVSQADLILAFGAGLTYWTTRSPSSSLGALEAVIQPGVRVAQCDTNPAALGALWPINLGVVGDAALTAAALTQELDRRGFRANGLRSASVRDEIAGYRLPERLDRRLADGCVDPHALFSQLARLLPAERTVAVDSGRFMEFPARYLSVAEPSAWVFTQDFQAMGLGIGSAVGAAVARPDRLTVLVIGDGGLMMSLGELDSVIHQDIPLLILIVNDHAYGPEVEILERHGLPNRLSIFHDVDFAAIARGMGAEAFTLRNVDDLERVRNWVSNRAPAPLIVDCKIDPLFRSRQTAVPEVAAV